MIEPVINFNGYEIQHYHYVKKNQEEILEDNSEKENPFSISVESGTTEDLLHGKVNVQVLYDLPEVSIDIEVTGFFDINTSNDLEKAREYLVVNGTAIIFPYIRSMISMLSSLDSEKSIIIPTINTTNLLNKD